MNCVHVFSASQKLSSWSGMLPLFWMFFLVPPSSTSALLDANNNIATECPPVYNCTDSIPILFPFAPTFCPQNSGINLLECKANLTQISLQNHSFTVKGIDYIKRSIAVAYQASFKQDFCRSPVGLTTVFLHRLVEKFSFLGNNITVSKCRSLEDDGLLSDRRNSWKREDCGNGWKLFFHDSSRGSDCASYQVPAEVGRYYDASNFAQAFSGGSFEFRWKWDFDCLNCTLQSGGRCGFDDGGRPVCFCKDGSTVAERCKAAVPVLRRNIKVLIIIIGLASACGSAMVCLLLFVFHNRYCPKWVLSSAYRTFLTHSLSLSSIRLIHLESTSFHQRFQGTLTIFSYHELQEATDNFSPCSELGDGGFGVVYRGKLRDGREAAIKRLYENSYNRHEQFINEIEILSSVSHPNLVCLYGCTTRHSRALLLVYEYMNNGSVSDHLHGPCAAAEGILTWKLRLRIALKTAEALGYLHQLEPPIIHRDVKTTNILLDKNFEVKVADFGLSRLLPFDTSHISTVPQGTPGYIAPEYHQCFQLTEKSDVYSFGVVLIELISSLPAIDILRHRHDISLANLAINKIHSNALHELVDPNIGFESDGWVKWSVQAVAELAYRCLASEREIRPTMNEVVKELRQIHPESWQFETPIFLGHPTNGNDLSKFP